MPVREKPDGWLEPERPRNPRRSVEREVGVSHAVEGSSAEGPMAARLSPMEAARQRSGASHHDRGRRRRKLRVLLVVGAVVLAMVPWSLRMSEAIEAPRLDATAGTDLLLTTMTSLKAVMAVAALGAIAWRLRRRASAGRRTGYIAGTWMMALGLGFIAIHENFLTGVVLFDAGAALIVACAFGDEWVRRDRPSVSTSTGTSASTSGIAP